MKSIKIAALYACKYLGVFHFSRLLTRNGLRILCFHGFSIQDEHLFRPKLFITKDKFQARLKKLTKMDFNVVSLDFAVKQLREGRNISNSVVITIDDGWYGVYPIAVPALEYLKLPWTLYQTTYYAEKQTQVMNLAIQYLFWKTGELAVDLKKLDPSFIGVRPIVSEFEKQAASDEITRFGLTLESASLRQELVRHLAVLLDVPQQTIEDRRLFNLLTLAEVSELNATGVDIQLHTHRHSLGQGGQEKIAKEILDNQSSLEKVGISGTSHFCYPSGNFRPNDFQHLKDCGVISATTCESGFNYKDTNLYRLSRFLDGEHIHQIEFEAELTGFLELSRKTRSWLNRLIK